MFFEKVTLKSLLPIIGTITAFELFSFLSYQTPWLNSAFFILICLVATIVTYKKLEWGLLLIITELLIGSQGYLFYLTFQDHKVSIRIGLFMVVIAVWLVRHASWQRLQSYGRERVTQLFLLFLAVIGLGGILGFLYHNGLGNIVADGKRYLYFGLFFIFLDVYSSNLPLRGERGVFHLRAKAETLPRVPSFEKGFGCVHNLLCILFATVITLSIKSAALLVIFIYNLGNEWSTRLVYGWVRTSSRVGEITDMKNGFFRIFIQSQIFELVAIFIVATGIAWLLYRRRTSQQDAMNRVSTMKGNKIILLYLSLLTLSCFTVVLSLSRSFWAGGFIAGILAVPLLIWRLKVKGLVFLQTVGLSLLALIIAVGAVFALGGGFSNRFNASEPAASSRWKLLPPLLEEARRHPFIGSGFGRTVTFQSDDPRIKNERNPEGWQTTYAFEWGYLDFIVKFGIIGTAIYGWFLIYILYEGWKIINPPSEGGTPGGVLALKQRLPSNEKNFIATGFVLGLIAVFGTHMFSPYLNHPLGIGYVLMSLGVFRALKKDSASLQH